ncbi:amino acid adenylation domain-containing protein [Sorangium sp. So ce124]|uniref:amino acid adenylation domain-containing protein n=1 Tax=Sorangium sp. So ce124 TaxID=3133280 RepID=UPI003F5ECC5C
MNNVAMSLSTLVDVLRHRAYHQPERRAFTFLPDGELEEIHVSYAELDRQARAIGATLQQAGATGERVLLLYPPGLGYIAAFFGCLYAGAVAVPAYPPDPSRLNRTLPRLAVIVRDAQATVALTTSPILSMAELVFEQAPGLKRLRWIATDEASAGTEGSFREPEISADTLAFVQYTSGSTGDPRGVMLTHRNLLHNEQMISAGFELTEDAKGLGWLPMYHDMGLLGTILQPICAGFPCVLMSPVSFLQRPMRWLEAISRHRATCSGGPNFAYDLCVRKALPEELAAVDLSSWSVAFSGAEPVRAETLDRFAATFGPHGFRREAFYPCYGLAEASLIVAGGRRADPPVVAVVGAAALERHRMVDAAQGEAARALVGCGRSLLDGKLVIVDPETLLPRAPGEVGEIWVGGASVAEGYWGRQEESERTFRARTAAGQGPLLRTGDLGCLRDGELFVTGRLKDLLIVRGRNLYPQDVERAVETSHPALRPGCSAAFAVEVDGEEQLVVVQEIDLRKRPDVPAVLAAVREAVTLHFDVRPHAVVLLEAGSIPKTSSGKIQRRACRDEYLSGALEAVGAWESAGSDEEAGAVAAPPPAEAPRSPEDIEAWLSACVSSVLNVPRGEIEAGRSLAACGLDSMRSVELASAIEAGLGVVLPLGSVVAGPTLTELAAEVAARRLTGAPLLAAGERPSEFPLSASQRALWFLYQLAPESAAYNLASAIRVTGDLDAAALRQAFEVLVDRHRLLRAVFPAPAPGSEPVQRILARPEGCFSEEDASAVDEASLLDRLAREADRPFDLERGPLFKVRLFRRSAREHVLLLTAHHIVLDFWSICVLVEELGKLYPALRAGGSLPALAPLPADYSDFVCWQSERLAGPEGERQWAYWQRQLASPPVLDLPADRPRPPVQTYRGASLSFGLEAGLTSRLKALAEDHGATLYMVLLAAVQVLLHRYSGQDDLLIGSPLHGRGRPELAYLVGYCVNPVALRGDLHGNPTFVELLGRVRRAVLDALDHPDYPMTEIVERLALTRDPSRSPLFQTSFTFQRAHLLDDQGLTPFSLGEAGASMSLSDLSLESLSIERAAQLDLTLMMAEAGGALRGSIKYNTDLFDAERIERMTGHLRTLLTAVVEGPERPVAELELLTAPEREQVLVTWNQTAAERPRECIHHLFEAQVRRSPDAVALVGSGGRLTYRELNERANRLSHQLRARGVGPEVLVGLCMERSLEMVVALLGILKAGGAYVPLDPRYPRERLQTMLEDSGVAVLLTQQPLLASLPVAPDRALCLGPGAAELSGCAEDPAAGARPDTLAYVIYTSGSTGAPKGVMIQHRSVVNLHRALELAVHEGAAPPLRVSLNASLSFDASVQQLVQLLSGHTLYIIPEDTRGDADALLSFVAQHRLDVLDCTPAHLRLLLEAGLGERSDGVPGRVLVGGDAVDTSMWGALARAPYARFYNVYGPTECTVDSAACRVDARSPTPVLGRGLANTQLYVLDGAMQPVPVGVPGELYIGGEGVARGYLKHPDLTADRFVPHPFSTTPGARLYRTGDRVRHLEGGDLEFLGRTDHQVKIRGFRVEPGEVEAALRRCAGVRDGVVVAREDAPGMRRLVAYVAGDPRVDSLREQLRACLPDYMVPSAFVVLESLPLSPSGKVDRRSLPEPDGALGDEHMAPRTPSEERLAAIFRDVLRAPRVGVTADFFELGGHSLLATQVVSRIRRELGVELPLRVLFEAPTVEQLAARLDREGARAAGPAIVPRAWGAGPRPISFAQERLWFLGQLAPESVAYNIPMALRFEGRLDVDALAKSVLDVTRRHESLRTTFAQDAEGKAVSVVHAEPLGGLAREDLRGQADGHARVRAEAEREARTPFDLKRGPLLRARLLALSEQEHVLLLTLHHIVSDGWSLGVFAREVMALYDAFVHHRGSPLPPLAVQYADYAAWQRAWLSGTELAAQTAYWKEHLAGAPGPLELPTDRPRPPVQTHAGATLRRSLGKDLSERIDALSHELGATPFMTLLAAFSVLLGRYCGQRDIIVGTPIANRTRAETEPLIGLFVNTLALRTDLSGEPTFIDLLGRVRQSTLDAYASQDLPFEKVVEALNVPRDLSRSPVFQVMFALQNAPAPALDLPGLTISPVDLDWGTSKFDLMLDVLPTKAGYVARWEFNSDLFDPQSVERLADHFVHIVEGALSRPDRSVYEAPILSAEERRSIVQGWNATRADFRPVPVHALFEETARRIPDVLAVLFDDRSMTYAELHRRSNRFARYLQKLGVEPHSLVGMYLERSLDVPVAILGVLKAGAAYVPMDASYPAERLRFMAEDARAPVVVTQSRLRHHVEGSGSRVVCMDDCAAAWEEPDADHAVTVDLSALCYVIYTSGSTGRPKGVALPHVVLTNLIQWQLTESTMGVGERTLQFSPLSFDVSFDEMFSTWASGGTLVLVSDEARRDPARLLDVIVRDRVARLFIPFVALQGIAEAARDKATLTALREIVCGGEQLQITPEVVEMYRQLPGSLLHNQYGPTESHFVTGYRLTGDPSLWPRLPPIGKPLFNTQMYVLDARLEPVPIGVRGDLYIAGVNLARCYWRRGDLTAERFVPNPFSDAPGARMYRTGDVARYLPDGNIEFLGRSDHQVKIRGFRVELAEIEQALMAIESVGAASAAVREDRPGLKRLVGYVVPKPGVALEARALREALSRRLPEYMVPSAFVTLESLPLSPSGKVDRKALPAPDDGSDPQRPRVAPRNALEEKLAAIWRDVLGVGSVGVHDSFFDLGGHSLLATQVASRLRDAFGVELPLRTLFERQSIAELAEAVTRASASVDDEPILRSAEPEDLLGQLDRLGERELDALLEELEPVGGLDR